VPWSIERQRPFSTSTSAWQVKIPLPNNSHNRLECPDMTSQSSNSSHWSANSTPILLSTTSSLTLPPQSDDDPPPVYTERPISGEITLERGPALSMGDMSSIVVTAQPVSTQATFDERMSSILRQTNVVLGELVRQVGGERRVRRVRRCKKLRQMYLWEGDE